MFSALVRVNNEIVHAAHAVDSLGYRDVNEIETACRMESFEVGQFLTSAFAVMGAMDPTHGSSVLPLHVKNGPVRDQFCKGKGRVSDLMVVVMCWLAVQSWLCRIDCFVVTDGVSSSSFTHVAVSVKLSDEVDGSGLVNLL